MLLRDRSESSRAQLLAPALPRVERRALEERNAGCRSLAPLSFTIASGPVRLARTGPSDGPEWGGSWLRIIFECSGRGGEVWLPEDVAAASLGAVFPDADLRDLDGADRAILIEIAERALLDAVSRALRAETTLIDAAPETLPERTPDFAFRLAYEDGTRYPVRVYCHPVERERIERQLALQPLSRTPFPGLTVPLAFRCGHTSLSLDEFARLEPGCGITFDDTTLGFQKLMAVVAERFVQTCAWQTIKPSLEGALLKPADPLTKLYTIDGFAMDDPQGRDGHASASVAEVPVNLLFELGRTEVLLSDLETMQAGYVFDLAKPLSQSVDILANGRRIGTGELVRVGESIGVRLVRLIR